MVETLNFAGCQLEDASVNVSAESGVTYSVICKSISNDMLTRLIDAAEVGRLIRIVFGAADVSQKVKIESLANGAVRVAGRVLRPPAE